MPKVVKVIKPGPDGEYHCPCTPDCTWSDQSKEKLFYHLVNGLKNPEVMKKEHMKGKHMKEEQFGDTIARFSCPFCEELHITVELKSLDTLNSHIRKHLDLVKMEAKRDKPYVSPTQLDAHLQRLLVLLEHRNDVTGSTTNIDAEHDKTPVILPHDCEITEASLNSSRTSFDSYTLLRDARGARSSLYSESSLRSALPSGSEYASSSSRRSSWMSDPDDCDPYLSSPAEDPQDDGAESAPEYPPLSREPSAPLDSGFPSISCSVPPQAPAAVTSSTGTRADTLDDPDDFEYVICRRRRGSTALAPVSATLTWLPPPAQDLFTPESLPSHQGSTRRPSTASHGTPLQQPIAPREGLTHRHSHAPSSAGTQSFQNGMLPARGLSTAPPVPRKPTEMHQGFAVPHVPDRAIAKYDGPPQPPSLAQPSTSDRETLQHQVREARARYSNAAPAPPKRKAGSSGRGRASSLSHSRHSSRSRAASQSRPRPEEAQSQTGSLQREHAGVPSPGVAAVHMQHSDCPPGTTGGQERQQNFPSFTAEGTPVYATDRHPPLLPGGSVTAQPVPPAQRLWNTIQPPAIVDRAHQRYNAPSAGPNARAPALPSIAPADPRMLSAPSPRRTPDESDTQRGAQGPLATHGRSDLRARQHASSGSTQQPAAARPGASDRPQAPLPARSRAAPAAANRGLSVKAPAARPSNSHQDVGQPGNHRGAESSNSDNDNASNSRPPK